MWASYKRDRERVIRPHTLIEKPACIEARVLHDVQNSRSPIPQKTSVKHKGTPRNTVKHNNQNRPHTLKSSC